MKYILLCIAVLLVHKLFAQVSFVYSIDAPPVYPQPGLPVKIQVEIEVSVQNNFRLLETKRTDGNSGNNNPDSVDVYRTLIDMETKRIYHFSDSLSVNECYALQTDTLVYTGKKAMYNHYRCDIYTVKNKPGIEVYCSKKIDPVVHPGICFFYEKPLGGVAKIEMVRNGATFIYQLISITKAARSLDVYVDKARQHTGGLMGVHSMLGS